MILRVATMRGAGGMLLLALAACGGGGEDAPPPAAPPPPGLQPTLTSIQNNVFTPSCAKTLCHAGPGAQAGLRLDPGFSWGLLVNVKSSQDMTFTRVIPMDPEASLLIQKLEGTAIVGARMPGDGPPYLQQVTIDVIRLWIQNGALDN